MGHAGFESVVNCRKRCRAKHLSEGKCYDCSKKSVDGKNYCQYHLDYQKKQYEKRKSATVQIASKHKTEHVGVIDVKFETSNLNNTKVEDESK